MQDSRPIQRAPYLPPKGVNGQAWDRIFISVSFTQAALTLALSRRGGGAGGEGVSGQSC
jgi:hypothetical protein